MHSYWISLAFIYHFIKNHSLKLCRLEINAIIFTVWKGGFIFLTLFFNSQEENIICNKSNCSVLAVVTERLTFSAYATCVAQMLNKLHNKYAIRMKTVS